MAKGYTGEEDGARAPAARQRCNGPLVMSLTVLIALAVAIAFFLYQRAAREQRQSEAIVNAAEAVTDSAKDVSQAISDAARRVRPKN